MFLVSNVPHGKLFGKNMLATIPKDQNMKKNINTAKPDQSDGMCIDQSIPNCTHTRLAAGSSLYSADIVKQSATNLLSWPNSIWMESEFLLAYC